MSTAWNINFLIWYDTIWYVRRCEETDHEPFRTARPLVSPDCPILSSTQPAPKKSTSWKKLPGAWLGLVYNLIWHARRCEWTEHEPFRTVSLTSFTRLSNAIIFTICSEMIWIKHKSYIWSALIWCDIIWYSMSDAANYPLPKNGPFQKSLPCAVAHQVCRRPMTKNIPSAPRYLDHEKRDLTCPMLWMTQTERIIPN